MAPKDTTDDRTVKQLLMQLSGAAGAKNRAAALEGLIAVFDKTNKSINLSRVRDETYHLVLEVMFTCALNERHSYLNTKSKKPKQPTALSRCAKAIRTTVTAGAHKLKRKTIVALVDHVTQVLPGPDGLVEPLAQNYIRALDSLCAEQSQVERLAGLDGSCWVVAVDFCSVHISELADRAKDVGSTPLSSLQATSSTASSRYGTFRNNTLSRSQAADQDILLALVQCLWYLVQACNAPVLRRADEISAAVFRVLRLKRSRSRVQLHAFSILNAVFEVIAMDDLKAAKVMSVELVPLITYWWTDKQASKDSLMTSLRDEMLKSMYLFHLHLDHNLQASTSDTLHVDTKELLDLLWSEYARRGNDQRLQLDDLTFVVDKIAGGSLRNDIFGLRPHNTQAERRWAILECIAILEGLLARSPHRDRQAEEEQPRKRRRFDHETSLQQRLRSSESGSQITGLQAVPFLLSRHLISSDDLDDSLLSSLVGLMGHKDNIISSWAMIASASCVMSLDILSESTKKMLKQAWHLAARTVGLPGTSRAACVFLSAVLTRGHLTYVEISSDINNLLSQNGPAVLVDSSLGLMSILLQVRNAKIPSASQATCSCIVRWVFSRWVPDDFTFASLHAPHVPLMELVNLLRSCCGHSPLQNRGPGLTTAGALSDTRYAQLEAAPLIRYLLLLDPVDKHSPTDEAPQSVHNAFQVADPSNYLFARRLVLELLVPKLEDLEQLCNPWQTIGKPVSPERLGSLVLACLVAANLASVLSDVNSSQSTNLVPILIGLVETGIRAALAIDYDHALTDLILQHVHPSLPHINADELSVFLKEETALLKVLTAISQALANSVSQDVDVNSDPMDMDDDFSQASKASSASKRAVAIPRHQACSGLTPESFSSNTMMRLYFLEALPGDLGQVSYAPEAFLRRVVKETNNEEFLLCQAVVLEVLASNLLLTESLAEQMVERVVDVIGEDEYDGSELSLAYCLDVLRLLSRFWVESKDDLGDMAEQLYSHFTKKLLGANALSPECQCRLAELLFTLMRLNPDYGASPKDKGNNKSLSCRTALLSILKNGLMTVKYSIGCRIADIFNWFVLKVHDEVFVDLLENLPTDPDILEGMAFRLWVLAKLACRWPTLLRRCTYHIFETPGRTGDFTEYATRCVSEVSTTLALASPRDLFGLFAPQLLYTWLERDSVQNIPHSIFGFGSLTDLLESCQSEAVALMIMRGQEENVLGLARILGVATADLLRRNFARALAYSIAYDESMDTKDKTHGDNWMRKQLRKDDYTESVYTNFVDIVTIFFDLMDQEEQMERYFAKAENLKYAEHAMLEMKQLCHSPVQLPPMQQPTFRAKYLINQLVCICNKTEFEFDQLWSASLITCVARRLLNTVHTSLGSLYACSVLRKVRILVAFAGAAAHGAYPLQMLLHSLRPFMVDSECADDAIGISQYLITNGASQLALVPPFLAGYSLSTLASLRVFLESSQSSTTQESQFKATMSKAQKFHSWLSRYLSEYNSEAFRCDADRNAFKSITQSASRIRSSGNAERGTAESDLLLSILGDGDRDHPLLIDSSRDLALDMLCGDFQLPARDQLDIIETDDDAVTNAPLVWKSCRTEALSGSYLAWAGRVIGKSFAATGDIPPELLRESRLSEYAKIAPVASDHSDKRHIGSEKGIIHLLSRLTWHQASETAGLAESALRYIVTMSLAKGDNDLYEACAAVLPESLILASSWQTYRIPPSNLPTTPGTCDDIALDPDRVKDGGWLPRLTEYLLSSVSGSIILSMLSPLIATAKGFADEAFPFITHLVIQSHLRKSAPYQTKLEKAINKWFSLSESIPPERPRLLINTILYLRMQPLPKERSLADRSEWLDIDFNLATTAASKCGMHKVALLFAEHAIHHSPTITVSNRARRSTVRSLGLKEMSEKLLAIYESIDDPDAYYGLPEDASLSGVLSRLEHENNSKGLVFRAAQYDSHISIRDPLANSDSQALVKALGSLGLSGLSHSLQQAQQDQDATSSSLENTFNTARKLEMWNLPAPSTADSPAVTMYKTYQAIARAADIDFMQNAIRRGLSQTMNMLVGGNLNAATIRDQLSALAALAELDDLVNVIGATELAKVFEKLESRNRWMRRGRYEDVSRLLSCRQTSLSMLSKQNIMLANADLSDSEMTKAQVRAMLLASGVYRFHEASQESLNIATSLNDLIVRCEKVGLKVGAAIKMEVADALWDHGEMMPSIRILQSIHSDLSTAKQGIPVSHSDILSKMGHRISVARLEKPDDVQRNWLAPALKALNGQHQGTEAGQVFHQFAVFCDQQLQNPDTLEDLARLQKLRQAKADELISLKEAFKMMKFRSKEEAGHWRSTHIARAQKWLDLDGEEVNRMVQARAEFMRLCLENYLLSLAASDDHNNDALRFMSLWMERANDDFANTAVRKHLDGVATRKFANIMNQLSSRLQDKPTGFQSMLMALVVRICVDHPYHGMYQIWTGTKTKVIHHDELSALRHQAMKKTAELLLKQGGSVAQTWTAIDRMCNKYVALAAEPKDYVQSKPRGSKFTINDSKGMMILHVGIHKYRIPPPTMQIEVRADKDYTQLPVMANLDRHFSFAGGVSAPKIITAIGSDGVRYKQLVKWSKNDDLRQDAIMEQVFAAVSSLLGRHRATQQRQLTIRTYKVLPLTATAGLIEFVPNTIPLHEWLIPAHERYNPKDLKSSECRTAIHDAVGRSLDTRVKVYRDVTARFQPVMRWFFIEKFPDPDDWFVKRLAYTRTTAAISILGHILGVGDRHGHNILLDAATGEVVHIDLGIAFEMGRVLPIPELVPFRLTRDVVDGMGITGTEGVFRRCCEFTLAALRNEGESVMSILDVLRYDPLYQWSISPARMQRLQGGRRAEDGSGAVDDDTTQFGKAGKPVSSNSAVAKRGQRGAGPGPAEELESTIEEGVHTGEPTEADRALEVVKRKLTKTLSVEATVYDLINQAEDERNLGLLFSGWAAYA